MGIKNPYSIVHEKGSVVSECYLSSDVEDDETQI